MTEHVHHGHPSRCCGSEPRADVLARLQANPPARWADKKGRFIEPEASWLARKAAYDAAVAREEG